MQTGTDTHATEAEPDPQLPFIPPVEEILARMQPRPNPVNEAHIRRAYDAGLKAHKGQLRRSGEPYYVHCVEVALLLTGLVSDWATISAGLLHDTVEDCGFNRAKIRAILPDPVADLVEGVTKISRIHFLTDHEHQAENLRKMILAMAKDVRVVLIKLCDRLHNMRTLHYLKPEKQEFIARSTLEIYAPLAKRLGMERISRELEDLCLSYLQPVLYRKLSEHLERNRQRYEVIIEETRGVLLRTLADAGINARVTGRLKHIYSLYKKMTRGGLDLVEIHDLIAMRIITDSVAQTYEVLGLVHAKWKPVEGYFKDYIATPKPNGYQSLHTTVIGLQGELTEIQIRTAEMHKSAEDGIAAHWKYKESGSEDTAGEAEHSKLQWLRQLVDWLSDIHDPAEFLAAVKQDVFEASVFLYTPMGDVIEMPTGCTLLDFAYRIHTDIGNSCSGVKLNHKMVPLRTRPQTGDIVEVITNKTAHPTQDWLQIAHTNRARNKIRHWLKTHNKQEYLDRGRAILAEYLRERRSDTDLQAAIDQLAKVAPDFSLKTAEDVLIELGFGSVKPGLLLSKIEPQETEPPPRKRKSREERRESAAPDKVSVEGIPGAVTRLAQCCAPSPGDPIIGFVTQTRGISVHHQDCRSVQRLRQVHRKAPNRMVEVHWGDDTRRVTRATIRVISQDRKGLLNDITQAVSHLGVNIIAAQTLSNLRTHRATIKLTVQIEGEGQINTLINRIQSVPSVLSVRGAGK